MTPIPGEPLDPKPPELTTSDGRKVKLNIPGLAPRPCPSLSLCAMSGGGPTRGVAPLLRATSSSARYEVVNWRSWHLMLR
jgi:hypothetical protein